MHATFFSMQVALALIYLLSLLIKEKAFNKRLFYFMCSGILALGLLQLSSKSVCIPLVIILNIVFPYFLLQGVKRRRFIWITASLTVLLAAGILCSGTLRERYVTQLTEDLSPANKEDLLDSRLARWNVAVKLISKAPIIGYGAGSEIGLLHEKFFDNKLYSSFLNNLNAHSQYLSFLLKSGIVGLLIYMSTLAYGVNISFRQKDLLFFSFMIIITAVSFSENYLDVDKGIIFYAFFFPFFFFSNQEPVTDPEPKDQHKYLTPLATKQLIVPSSL
jgi:O-antigen ligase